MEKITFPYVLKDDPLAKRKTTFFLVILSPQIKKKSD
jgi:hypothetical protein